MQFILECHGQDLFNIIYERLNLGSAFFLFEKVRAPDARFQDMMTTIYHDYRLRNEFFSEEIMATKQSMNEELDPFSTVGNLGLLKRAGIVDIMTVLKYVNFEDFLAVKSLQITT